MNQLFPFPPQKHHFGREQKTVFLYTCFMKIRVDILLTFSLLKRRRKKTILPPFNPITATINCPAGLLMIQIACQASLQPTVGMPQLGKRWSSDEWGACLVTAIEWPSPEWAHAQTNERSIPETTQDRGRSKSGADARLFRTKPNCLHPSPSLKHKNSTISIYLVKVT